MTENNEKGILYIVATPIGNLEDITMRALRILAEVDFILCEDTRTTAKLLNHYKIKNKTISYHAHSTDKKHDEILKSLTEGKKVALVSDAGTPTISDPGFLLIEKIKSELGDEISVVPIPGPSAFVAALSASGISAPAFTFLGFLPHKKGRQTLFKEIQQRERPYIFYESTHRIEKTAESLKEIGIEKIVIARELTKHFETIWSGSPEALLIMFKEHSEQMKGEFVVIVP